MLNSKVSVWGTFVTQVEFEEQGDMFTVSGFRDCSY